MSSTRLLRAFDPILGALGVLFGLGSLTYPFGRDQGLYYYVAREWVLRGSIPYRDVLDHKTPGIYLLHALSVLLFGETMWGIRLLDLLCVVAVGFAAASLSAARGEPPRPGVRGAAILTTSVLFYGYLDFWNTAQSELWYAMLAIASVAAAVRVEKTERAATLAGVLGGAALLMKPPAIWIVLVAVGCIVHRTAGSTGALRERAKPALRPLVAFAIGGAVVPGLVLGYFGAKGALPAMFDIVVGANSFYVKREKGGAPLEAVPGYHWGYFPLVPALLLYLMWAVRRSDRARAVLALAITAGAYLAVIMQGKYYLLHWSVCIPAFAIVAAHAARTMFDRWAAIRRAWAFAPSFVALLSVLYLGSTASWHSPRMWWTSSMHAWRYAQGAETREELTWHFAEPGIGFFFWTSERVGTWLRDHTSPDDFVAVRGFQPEIYAVAQRRHSGRFFWTTFLVNPARAYRRSEWLAEDLADLKANPPKYVVALTHIPEGPDSVAYFRALGYRPVEVMWEFTIMERAPR